MPYPWCRQRSHAGAPRAHHRRPVRPGPRSHHLRHYRSGKNVRKGVQGSGFRVRDTRISLSPPAGNVIKLSRRTSWLPIGRESCPKGLCKRTGFLGVKRRENPVRRHFERSEMRGLCSVCPTLFDNRQHAPIAFGTSPGGGSKILQS